MNTSGRVGVCFGVSTDPDGDEISYYVEWGDNSEGESSELLSSGEYWEISHTWYSEGAYIIKAKAIDSNGAESDWSYLTVTMPRNKTNNLRTIVIDNYPILRIILKYLDLCQFLR